MDVNNYEAVFWELASSSDDREDIWDCEYYEKLLAAYAGISPEESMEVVTRMQLAEERVSRLWEGSQDIPQDTAGLLQKRELDLYQMLQDKINAYAQEERQGFLVGMLEGSRQLLNYPVGEREIIRLVRKTAEELLQYLQEDVKRISSQLFLDESSLYKVFAEEMERKDNVAAGKICVAAGAAAAYICEPGLRELPQSVGMVSGAAARVAEGKNYADPAGHTRRVAYLLQMVSYGFVLEALMKPLDGSKLSGTSVSTKTPVTLAGVTESFLLCIRMLVIEVRAASGLQDARIVEESVMMVEGWEDFQSVVDDNLWEQALTDAGVRNENRDTSEAAGALEEELVKEVERAEAEERAEEASAGNW